MIANLPHWIQIFILSMIPGIESRYIIPYSIYQFGWDWWKAFPIALAGNMILVPFGLLFFKKVEQYLRRYRWWKKSMDKIFPKIRFRADKKIQRYENFALLFFVALPLPFTGAGLGVLIAYLFDLPFIRSLIMIFIGVIISALITTTVFLTYQFIFF
ncbi:MAG: ligand-binding protein SH3 [Candidatus Lokiarchaeota archaeon]|nr:ligand-binding protein SH3 [Candidatus Lokiarchaeota archaeon]